MPFDGPKVGKKVGRLVAVACLSAACAIKSPQPAASQAPDLVVSRALALLDKAAPLPIVVVTKVDRHGRNQVKRVAATDGRTAIYVYADSDAYRKAIKGDARQLAAALAHEICHVERGDRFGDDERPAYLEQLRVLRALGASKREIDQVERAAARTKAGSQ